MSDGDPTHSTPFIGTAGWGLPRAFADRVVPGDEPHLERYARLFSGVEINTSFYRPHARATYARWAAMTPTGFRFAIKLPRAITHDAKLLQTESLLDRFFDETSGLGEKRGPILVQLPPSLAFDRSTAARFFEAMRSRHAGAIACEPRHATWLDPVADALLGGVRVARVAADPPRAAGADEPGGWRGLLYIRLHGAPRTYWSSYTPDAMARVTRMLRSAATERWCIFDNTAAGAACENAWELLAGLRGHAGERTIGSSAP